MKLKRNPGEWLQEKRLDLIPDVVLPATVGGGWLCGAGLTLWTVYGTRLFSGSIPLHTLLPSVLPGLLALIFAWYKYKGGWRLQNMKKGELAEQIIGQKIEYALTRDACAVAHNVKKVARYGDIDHLVATPHGLWVIETKYQRIPNKVFNKALGIIADNVKALREQAPPDTQVTGCLVFAVELNKPPTPTREVKGEMIRIFGKWGDLQRELRNEARETKDSWNLASWVWKLGKLD